MKPKHLLRLFLWFLSVELLFAASAREWEFETLRDDSRLRRAKVLLLNNQVSREEVFFVQALLEDQIIVTRLCGRTGKAGDLLRGMDGISKEKYQLICFDFETENAALNDAERESYGKTLRLLAEKMKGLGQVVVWCSSMKVECPNRGFIADIFSKEGIVVGNYNMIVDAKTDGGPPNYSRPLEMTTSFAGLIRSALLRYSTPWAVPPEGRREDLSFLTSESLRLEQPERLRQAKGESHVIYRAREGEWQFNMHPFIAHHDGLFWVIWSSGRVDEDSPSQFIRYATSVDGKSWSEPKVFVADPDGEDGPLRGMPGGLHSRDGKLMAYATLHKGSGKDGLVWQDARLHRFLWIGSAWKDEGVMAEDTLIYFPPMQVGEKDFLIKRNGMAGVFTVLIDPLTGKWEEQELPGYLLPKYRMSETSHYVDPEGVLHLILRDQGRSMRLYHSVSFDKGRTWTIPVRTNYPDAVSKNLSGRLSNGWYYLINTPLTRRELCITFSRDGWVFRAPLLIRGDPPELRYRGKAKDAYSYNYSHAVEHDGKLVVVYSVNKEDIEVSILDISSLVPKK